MKKTINLLTLVLPILLFPFMGVMGQENEAAFKKGSWHTGLTMNITDASGTNLDYLIVEMPDFGNEGFSVNFLGGYFFADDMSAGLRYNYAKRELDFMYDWNDALSHFQYAQSKHRFIAFLRNYYAIGTNKRFVFFNETDLGAGFGNSLMRHAKNERELSKSFSDEFTLELGVRPGVSVILTKGFAFEVSVGLLGLTYSNKDIIKNGIEEGNKRNFDFDFDISLLALDFGLAYYF